jgi:hypothetical protein
MQEEIQKTEIRMAEVRARFDPNQEGVFYAGIEGISDGASLMVNYVSPYGSAAKAGFIGVPEVGASILVCKPSGSNEWFYIGSTFLPEDKKQGEDTLTTPPFSRVDSSINKVSGVPAKVILHGNNGQGLEISDEQDGETTNNIKTELTSSNGKKITLHDSPGIDAIKLDSGNNASITLTQNPQNNPQKSAASIEVDCNGPQLHVSRQSDLEMKVLGGGRELNIQNNANGVAWGNFQHANPINPCGNVNIQSSYGDVNIMSKSPVISRVFIETLDPAGGAQLIQLKTNGPTGTIVLKTAGTLAIDAGEVAIQSAGNIAMGCNGVFSVEALGGVAAQTPANIDLEGATVNLAPGSAPTIPVEPIIATRTASPLNNNDYFGRGLE